MGSTKAQVEAAAQERAEAIAELEQLFAERVYKPEVALILRSVNRAGDRRVITPLVCAYRPYLDKPDITNITGLVASALKLRCAADGVVIHGGGMDMGFELVYRLSAALYGHRDEGGYRLRHRWL